MATRAPSPPSPSPPASQASSGYQLQELKCVKCRTVATNHLQQSCDVCGGHLRASQLALRVQQRLSALRGVARHQGMAVLDELAAWGLQGL